MRACYLFFMVFKKQRRWVPVSGVAGLLVVVILAVEVVLMSGWLENSRSSQHEWLFGFLGIDDAEQQLESSTGQRGPGREERLPTSVERAVDPVKEMETPAPAVDKAWEEVKPVDDSVPVG